MTSEIAVMNQRAVALAADSAVTLIDGGTVVVRNDQRKLYNLVEGRPVGVMFFGVADIMGHPWEHLIEHYQKKVRPKEFAHLGDYAHELHRHARQSRTSSSRPTARRTTTSGCWPRCSATSSTSRNICARPASDADDQRRHDPRRGDRARLARLPVPRRRQRRAPISPASRKASPPRSRATTRTIIDELIAYGFAPFGLGASRRCSS